jgi:hypothetical protein
LTEAGVAARKLLPAGARLQVEFLAPIRVVSEANERCHHMVRFKRKRAQQQEIHVEWKRATRGGKVSLPCVVYLTRIGLQRLDDDNLASAFKFVRDQIARELGVDDGGDLVEFRYGQIAVGRRVYGVHVAVC